MGRERSTHWFLRPAIVAAWAPVLAALISGVALYFAQHDSGSQSIPQPTPSYTSPGTSSEFRSHQGEIWTWALGRNVRTDPDLKYYKVRDDGSVVVQSEGFILGTDASGAVTAVTLYNDESALGLPYVDSNMKAYKGSLPEGLSWRDTATEVISKFGSGKQFGGYGIPITLTYPMSGGRYLEVELLATHENDLANSPIHSISVSQA